MDTKICSKCGATWLEGQHYWSGTGSKGNELDLAGLVCNTIKTNECINPSRGELGGDTWAKRLAKLEAFEEKFTRQNNL